MGTSSSNLLDESRSNYIRGRTEAELKNFSPHYRQQYLVAFFSQLQEEVEQHRPPLTQLLKRREPSEAADVLYGENVLHFDDTRKWKERYVVVRADYSLECHDSQESFLKGAPPRQTLLPAGGDVLTSEEKYMAEVDKDFPDPNGLKEEPASPVVAMPEPWPVYLRPPYHRDAYFCIHQPDRQARFVCVLNDCIRHQNHDSLKKPSCETLAFLKAIQFYRQEKGHYESWDMLVGTDVQVLTNLVMDELLPTLQTELLPRLKGKKPERRRLWFATVEAAYILVQGQLAEGFAALKEECAAMAKQQEALIRSDMDQIVSSKAFLTGKLSATMSEPAMKFCTDSVQPYLASILEELIGPISSGFQEVHLLCEREMERLCQDIQVQGSPEGLKTALYQLAQVGLQDCYQHVDVLYERLQELRNRFKFSNTTHLVQSAQIDMQKLMENAAYTFELLMETALKDSPAQAGTAMQKVKARVLKQYDYDSSTVRKRIFHEALADITLPAIRRSLAPTCKPELQKFEQYIFADYTNFIQVENVYEDILLHILDSEITKVVQEAASLKKHNLFMDSTDLQSASQASLIDSQTLLRSTPSSPAKVAYVPRENQPASPLLGNGQLERTISTDNLGQAGIETVEMLTVEMATKEADTMEKGTKEADTMEKGTKEADTMEKGTNEAVTMEKGTKEADTMEKGTNEAVTMEKGTNEAVTMEKGTKEADTMEKGTNEAVTMEKGTNEADTMEKGTNEAVTMEKGTNEADTMEKCVMETGTKEVGTVEVVAMVKGTMETGCMEVASIEAGSVEASVKITHQQGDSLGSDTDLRDSPVATPTPGVGPAARSSSSGQQMVKDRAVYLNAPPEVTKCADILLPDNSADQRDRDALPVSNNLPNKVKPEVKDSGMVHLELSTAKDCSEVSLKPTAEKERDTVLSEPLTEKNESMLVPLDLSTEVNKSNIVLLEAPTEIESGGVPLKPPAEVKDGEAAAAVVDSVQECDFDTTDEVRESKSVSHIVTKAEDVKEAAVISPVVDLAATGSSVSTDLPTEPEDPTTALRASTSLGQSEGGALPPLLDPLARGAGPTSVAEESQPLDSVKAIRDLVVEIIEFEELVQRPPES